jgi:hypothetical protein
MRICQLHWNILCEEVKNRGLWSLVLKSGEEAMDNMRKEVEGKPHKFDPLMAANNAIWNFALDTGGLYMLGQNPDSTDDGHFCPLCEAKKYSLDHPDMDKNWIEGCMNDITKYVNDHKLLDLN